jgi:hypothetical protein
MKDLTSELFNKIQTTKLLDLHLKDDCIHPAYGGLSILNLPGSLSQWFGAGGLYHPPIDIPELNDLAQSARQVICVLIDALALHRFQRWITDRNNKLQGWLERGLIGALTSIVPSTTSAALTTLWTGRSPAEHGILGYEIFLREFGLIANMITHAPAIYDGHSGLLYKAGFEPDTFLPVKTIGPHLQTAGVDVHAFLHYSISGSGLSRMHYPAVTAHSFAYPSDLWIDVRDVANHRLEDKRLIWVYHSGVDSLSHRHGPDSEQAKADFLHFTDMMVTECLEKIEPAVAAETLLLLLADHGQLSTRKDPNFELSKHPELSRRLHMSPTGENRLPYLYVKPGQTAAVEEYLERTWPGAFSVLPSSQLLDAGLFGPGTPSERTLDRLGDLTVITHQDAYLWWAAKENPLIGRHGGLSNEEMLVPLMAVRLD